MLILCISPGCCTETTRAKPICRACFDRLPTNDRPKHGEPFTQWLQRIRVRYGLPPHDETVLRDRGRGKGARRRHRR